MISKVAPLDLPRRGLRPDPVDGVGKPLIHYTPNLPTNIVPTNIAWLKLSGRSPMDMRIPPL